MANHIEIFLLLASPLKKQADTARADRDDIANTLLCNYAACLGSAALAAHFCNTGAVFSATEVAPPKRLRP